MKKPKKQIFIFFKSLEEFKKEALQSIKSRKTNIQPENIIYFDSLASFRGFMSLQKLEILTLISHAEPNSIYELTRLLDRSLAAVQKDCEALEQVGFITLERKKTGRGQLIPRLKFDYDRIVVELRKHTYELAFRAVA